MRLNREKMGPLFLRRGDDVPDGSDGGAEMTRNRTIRRGGWRIKVLPLLLSAFLCIVSAEVAARAFWSLSYGVPFRDPGRILYAYYPELRRVDGERPTHGDKFYDILFLGGSTLHRDFSQVEQVLLEELAYKGHRNVRIFNLAMTSHTSRDSWIKYGALGAARFELVLFYDGINETRANNAPPEIFREDYSHYSWYEDVNMLASYHGTASFALPYTLRHLVNQMRRHLTKDSYVPINMPRKDWVQYGRDSRSAVSFKHNLSAIIELARRRGDGLLLTTFATYVPKDYSLESFLKKSLDYGLHLYSFRMWGAREHVLETVAVQNEIVRSLAAQHEGVLFVDQANLMAGFPRYFNDPCHFTVVGSSIFVQHLLRVLLPRLENGKAAGATAGDAQGSL